MMISWIKARDMGRSTMVIRRAHRMLLVRVVAGIMAFVFLDAAAFAERHSTTSYDAQQQAPRPAPWEQEGTNVRRESIGSNTIESSNLQVDAEAALASSFDRIRQNPGWIALEDQADDQTNRIGDLEDLLDQMELASSWQEEPAQGEPWNSGSAVASSTWEPAVVNQTEDFTQSRVVTKQYARTVRVYESIVATGERRLKDTYTETKTIDETESRIVDVANTPGGGADGWSDWSGTGSYYNCGAYSPARSTVNSGVRYTQTRYCDQDQQSTIYYLTQGSVFNHNVRYRTSRVADTRSVTGTKTSCLYTSGNIAAGDPVTNWQVIRSSGANSWVGWKGTAFNMRSPSSRTYTSSFQEGGREYRRGTLQNSITVYGVTYDNYSVCRE